MKKLLNKFLDRVAVREYKNEMANMYLEHYRWLYRRYMAKNATEDDCFIGALLEARWVLHQIFNVDNDVIMFIEDMEDKKRNA